MESPSNDKRQRCGALTPSRGPDLLSPDDYHRDHRRSFCSAVYTSNPRRQGRTVWNVSLGAALDPCPYFGQPPHRIPVGKVLSRGAWQRRTSNRGRISPESGRDSSDSPVRKVSDRDAVRRLGPLHGPRGSIGSNRRGSRICHRTVVWVVTRSCPESCPCRSRRRAGGGISHSSCRS